MLLSLCTCDLYQVGIFSCRFRGSEVTMAALVVDSLQACKSVERFRALLQACQIGKAHTCVLLLFASP